MLSFPYLRIAMLVDAGVAARQTAASYLHALADGGLLTATRRGRSVYFVNQPMVDILRN